jgi:hypothetical protein
MMKNKKSSNLKLYAEFAKEVDTKLFKKNLKKMLISTGVERFNIKEEKFTDNLLKLYTGISPLAWSNWTTTENKTKYIPSDILMMLVMQYDLDLKTILENQEIKKIKREARYE